MALTSTYVVKIMILIYKCA